MAIIQLLKFSITPTLLQCRVTVSSCSVEYEYKLLCQFIVMLNYSQMPSVATGCCKYLVALL